MSRAALFGGLLGAAIATAFVVFDSRGLPFPVAWIATESVGAGEMLLHRVETADLVSYTMPLASVSDAVLFSHPSPSVQKLYWSMTRATVYALSVILGLLLAGWAAGILALAALPPLAVDQLHTTYSVLVLLVAGMLVRRERTPSPVNSALLALAIGVSLLYRSPLVFFPLALAVFDHFSAPRGARPGWKALLSFTALPYALLLPWVWLNWILKGAFIPLEHNRTGRGIVTAILGFVQKTDLDIGMFFSDTADPTRAGGVMGWALGQIGRHPLVYLDSCLRRGLYIFSFNPVLFLAAIAALWLHRRRPEWRALGLLVAYFTAVHCAVTVAPAYLVPLWPLLAALAGTLPATLLEAYDPGAGAHAREAASRAFVIGLALASVFAAFTLWTVAAYGQAALRRPLRSPKVWEAALATDGASCSWLLTEDGRRRLAQGDLPGARDKFSKAHALSLGDTYGELYLDWTMALQGHAAPLMRLKLDPNMETDTHIKLDFLRAQIALAHGDKATARTLITSALKRWMTPSYIVQWPAKPRPSTEILRTRPHSFLMASLDEILRPMTARERDGFLLAIAREGDPNLVADVWLTLALSAAETGDRARALANIDVVKDVELRPEEIKILLNTYLRLKLPGAASSFIMGLPATSAPEAWLDLAELSFQIKNRGLSEAALGMYALLHRMESNPRAAALLKTLAAQKSGQANSAAGESALLLRDKGNMKEALTLLQAAAERRPDDVVARLDLATVALDAGRKDLAQTALEAAAKLRPEPKLARIAAGLFSRSGDDTRAVRLLEESLARQPDEFDTWIDRASLEKKSDRSKAVRSIDGAERLAKTPAQRRVLALAYQGLGVYPKACPRLTALTLEAPTDAGLLVDKGVCAYLQGATKEAERDFKGALRLEPTLAGAALSLGAIYAQQRRPAEARRIYDEILARIASKDPSRKEIMKARQELFSPRAKIQGAEHADQ